MPCPPRSTTRCRYLPKFKWDALTEEINYQRAVREQRLVAEISAAKRERDFYLSRWEGVATAWNRGRGRECALGSQGLEGAACCS